MTGFSLKSQCLLEAIFDVELVTLGLNYPKSGNFVWFSADDYELLTFGNIFQKYNLAFNIRRLPSLERVIVILSILFVDQENG